jgi:hypothetical protein
MDFVYDVLVYTGQDIFLLKNPPENSKKSSKEVGRRRGTSFFLAREQRGIYRIFGLQGHPVVCAPGCPIDMSFLAFFSSALAPLGLGLEEHIQGASKIFFLKATYIWQMATRQELPVMRFNSLRSVWLIWIGRIHIHLLGMKTPTRKHKI